MGIKACEEGCKDCEKDILRYNELLDKLRDMHISGATETEELCLATFRFFQRDHPDFNLYPQIQGEFLGIAIRHKEPWTQI